MPRIRLIASEVSDPDRRWSMVNTRAAAAVASLLLAVVVAGALGLTWAIWAGFAAGGVAMVGAGLNLWRGLGGPRATTTKVSRAENRRMTRVLWRGGPIAVEDTELADKVARPGLRNFGLNVWTGPLIAAAQLDALPMKDGGDVFRAVLLVLAFGLTVLALVANVRFRRGLLDRTRSTVQ